MSTITIYEHTIERSIEADNYPRSTYSLEPWGTNTTMIHGSDDGGREYVLPAGYAVHEAACDTLMIYRDGQAQPCVLGVAHNGLPLLWDEMGRNPIILRPASEVAA